VIGLYHFKLTLVPKFITADKAHKGRKRKRKRKRKRSGFMMQHTFSGLIYEQLHTICMMNFRP
jgi:hypothetical protein